MVLFLFFIFSFIDVFSTEPEFNNKVHTVVIDPGHGGKDPGALGRIIQEKDVVLSISLKLGRYIEENFEDVKVIYTRKTDRFIPLDERAEIANREKADLFISIHANALPNAPAVGTETFVMGINKDSRNFEVARKENSVILLEDNYETRYQGFDPQSIDSYIIFSVMQKTYQKHSLAFAKMVQDEFENRAKRKNRGVKQDGFWVLWRTTMPSVLIETGFLTHPAEEKFLASETGQDYLASAIYRAFKTYKNTIEGNSNFLSLNENENLEESPAFVDPSEAGKTNDSKPEIFFKVQVMVSGHQVEDSNNIFGKYGYLEEYKSGKWFKYAVGKSSSYKEIERYCETVRKDFPDAFIIALHEDKIISLSEALRILNME